MNASGGGSFLPRPCFCWSQVHMRLTDAGPEEQLWLGHQPQSMGWPCGAQEPKTAAAGPARTRTPQLLAPVQPWGGTPDTRVAWRLPCRSRTGFRGGRGSTAGVEQGNGSLTGLLLQPRGSFTRSRDRSARRPHLFLSSPRGR